jgi:hypothetical protein
VWELDQLVAELAVVICRNQIGLLGMKRRAFYLYPLKKIEFY